MSVYVWAPDNWDVANPDFVRIDGDPEGVTYHHAVDTSGCLQITAVRTENGARRPGEPLVFSPAGWGRVAARPEL